MIFTCDLTITCTLCVPNTVGVVSFTQATYTSSMDTGPSVTENSVDLTLTLDLPLQDGGLQYSLVWINGMIICKCFLNCLELLLILTYRAYISLLLMDIFDCCICILIVFGQ